MEPLQPVIRPYDWGSRHGIAELQGRPVPAPGPEAELWMGAHPSAPSGVAATTLDAVIAADPDRELGHDCLARFGPRLPFLLKVLSADRALSIQVHPSRAQAQAGFRAEHDRGLPPADRNYVDDWPKPELLCALTPFEVLAGLRTPSDAAALLRALAVAPLAPVAADLAAATRPEALSRALAAILTWPDPEELVPAVVAACRELAQADPGPGPGPYTAACAAAVDAAARSPRRPGRGGHAADAPRGAGARPGGVHARRRPARLPARHRRRGAGQLRQCGPGGPDRQARRRPRAAEAARPGRRRPRPVARPRRRRVSRFATPAPEFALWVAELPEHPITLPGTGPRIVLCTGGAARLEPDQPGPGPAVRLARGESCFVSAADGPLRARGPARLFLAAPGAARQQP